MKPASFLLTFAMSSVVLFHSVSAKPVEASGLCEEGAGEEVHGTKIDWTATASDLRGRLDQDFTFICSSGGAVGSVWGTNTYTDDSSICTAAVHAGLITAKDGGQVTIRILPGEELYNGEVRNGVKSQEYGSFSGSFIFLKPDGSPLVVGPQALLLAWDGNASRWRGRLDQDFMFDCPPNGSLGVVWGTDVYTDDSSICSAAVHAGIITLKKGGRVTIRIRPGAESYLGTTSHGVVSQPYGGYSGSFVFIKSSP